MAFNAPPLPVLAPTDDTDPSAPGQWVRNITPCARVRVNPATQGAAFPEQGRGKCWMEVQDEGWLRKRLLVAEGGPRADAPCFNPAAVYLRDTPCLLG